MKSTLLNILTVGIILTWASLINKSSACDQLNKSYRIRFESNIDQRFDYLRQVTHFRIYLNDEIYLASDNLDLLNTDLVFSDPDHKTHDVLVILTYRNGAERILKWNPDNNKSSAFVK